MVDKTCKVTSEEKEDIYCSPINLKPSKVKQSLCSLDINLSLLAFFDQVIFFFLFVLLSIYAY